MRKSILLLLAIFSKGHLLPQSSPSNVTFPPIANPLHNSVDSYTRATTSINLKPGFKFGFVSSTPTNTNLLNLSISNNPSFVSSNYLGSSSNPALQSCGTIPTVDMTRLVGETSGNFDVTSTGGFSYNIPIVISPGTSGIQPNLSLNYISQGGLGLAGVGWTLGGISTITRINKTPMHDGSSSSFQLSTNDKFALDGNRLFGFSGSTYGQPNCTYYTESENFCTITSFGSAGNGPERFEVKDKYGNLLKYGYDNNSSLKGAGDNTVLVWYMNEMKDEFGNYMKYYYNQLNGETVLDRIEYTGNSSAALSPYNKVTFSYMPLAEHNKSYINGKEFNQTQLIRTISCWSGSVVMKKYELEYEWRNGSYLSMVKEIDANGNELNPLRFCWDDPNNYNITKTNQNLNPNFSGQDYAGLRSAPVDFDGDGFSDFASWNEGAGRHRVFKNNFLSNYGTTNSTIGFTNVYDNATQIGIADAVLSSNVCDENLDGKQELFTVIAPRKFIQSNFTFSDEYTILKTYYDNTNSVQVSNLGTFNTSSGNLFDVDASPPQLYFNRSDFTGDGNVDQLRIDNEFITLTVGANTYQRALNSGPNSFARPFNFDGDGVSDYIVVTDALTSINIEIIKFTGSSFYSASTGNISIPYPNNSSVFKFLCKHITFGDLNADGLEDLVYVDLNNTEMYVIRNTGNSFASAKKIDAFTALGSTNDFDISCTDVNADGKKDIIINENDPVSNKTTYYSYISYGDVILKGGSYIGDWKVGEALCTNYSPAKKDFGVTVEGAWTYYIDQIWTSNGNSKVITGMDIHYSDFNGDGVYDQVNFDSNSNFIVTNNVNGESRLAITNIYTPLRNNIEIRYANIASRFAVNNGLVDEILKPITSPGFSNGLGILLTNMYCVSHVVKTSGYSGQFQSTQRYLYKNPTYHQFGLGFLGFEEVTSVNLNTMIGTVSTSSVLPTYYLLANYLQQTSKFTAGSVSGVSNSNTYSPDITKIISVNEKTVTCVPQNTSSYFMKLDRTVSTDYLGSTRSSNEYVYDMVSTGNLLTQTSKEGWNLSSPLVLSSKSYTYSNINGIFKPVRKYMVNTQLGESPYEREIVSNYDGQGRLTSTVNDQNIPSLSNHILTTTYSNFDPFGNATKVIISAPDLAVNRSSETIYDNFGRFVIKKINAIGDFVEYVINPQFGNIVQSKDISGLITTYQYDAIGRLVKTTLPNNVQTKVTYAWESPSSYPYESQVTGAYSVKTETDQQPYLKEYFSGNQLKLRSETQDYTGNAVISDMKYNSANSNGFPDGTLLEVTEPHYPAQNKYLKTVYDYETTFYRQIKNTTYSVSGGSSYITNIYTITNYNQPSNTGFYSFAYTETVDGPGKTLRKSLNSAGQVTLITNSTLNNNQKATYTYFSNGNLKNITLTTPSNPNQNIVYSYTYNDLAQKTQVMDPSRGTSTYAYNTLGELLQSNEQFGTFNYTYDLLGRLDTKIGSTSGTSTYQYVTSGNGLEMLKKINGPISTSEFQYDNYGRMIESKETIPSENKIIKSNYTFDIYGREVQHTYSNGIVIKKTYNSYSHLMEIKDANNQILWQLTTKDALGRIREYSYGNGLNTTCTFDDLNFLAEIDHGSGTKFKQTYKYLSSTGNLISRQFDNYMTNVSIKDFFAYDNTDRLTLWSQQNIANNSTYNVNSSTFDALGNITHKDDAGDYNYPNPAKPFTLSQITNATSNVSPNTLNVLYNDLEKVSQLSEMGTNKQMDFVYGNTGERVKMEYSIGGTSQYKRYYGESYDRQESGSSYKEWTYIMAPSGLCAVYYNNNGTVELNYVVNDHLGTPILLMNSNSSNPGMIEEYAFDAWGRRRNPTDWSYSNISAPTKMIRGFTLHEHMDEFAMINMNGRIYYPVIGRFIQPDNVLLDENNLQSYNVYAYCNNNPLRYTDPTGHYGEPTSEFNWDGYFSEMMNYYSAPTIDNNAILEAGIAEANKQWAETVQHMEASRALTENIIAKYNNSFNSLMSYFQDAITTANNYISENNERAMNAWVAAFPIGAGFTETGAAIGYYSGGAGIISQLLKEGFDIETAVSTLNRNALAKSSGYCAKYVRWALEAGGINTNGHPGSAKDYDSFLIRKGFNTVNSNNYDPIKGDIAVFESFQGKKAFHEHGHIEMWDGKRWVSDFKQNGFWPGTDYRTYQPTYTILRWY